MKPKPDPLGAFRVGVAFRCHERWPAVDLIAGFIGAHPDSSQCFDSMIERLSGLKIIRRNVTGGRKFGPITL